MLLPLLLLLGGPSGQVDCLDLYYGLGQPRDLPGARRCLEGVVPAACGGESPDLQRAVLAVLFLDGQGGPADPKRGWSLLDDCFADLTIEEMHRAMDGRRPDGSFDFCHQLGGTTRTINECAVVDLQRAQQERGAAVARARTALGGAAAGLDGAEKAFDGLAEADAAVDGDAARGGTAATALNLDSRTASAKARAQWLDALTRYRPDPACNAAGLAAADRELNAAYRAAQARLADADGRKLLRAAQRAWIVSRDADAALAAGAFGSRDGAAAVSADVSCRATKARVTAVAAVGSAG